MYILNDVIQTILEKAVIPGFFNRHSAFFIRHSVLFVCSVRFPILFEILSFGSDKPQRRDNDSANDDDVSICGAFSIIKGGQPRRLGLSRFVVTAVASRSLVFVFRCSFVYTHTLSRGTAPPPGPHARNSFDLPH